MAIITCSLAHRLAPIIACFILVLCSSTGTAAKFLNSRFSSMAILTQEFFVQKYLFTIITAPEKINQIRFKNTSVLCCLISGVRNVDGSCIVVHGSPSFSPSPSYAKLTTVSNTVVKYFASYPFYLDFLHLKPYLKLSLQMFNRICWHMWCSMLVFPPVPLLSFLPHTLKLAKGRLCTHVILRSVVCIDGITIINIPNHEHCQICGSLNPETWRHEQTRQKKPQVCRKSWNL